MAHGKKTLIFSTTLSQLLRMYLRPPPATVIDCVDNPALGFLFGECQLSSHILLTESRLYTNAKEFSEVFGF